jgi:4-amino-4-deoxy-L-arabinose transferase-like glycosyltransferase
VKGASTSRWLWVLLGAVIALRLTTLGLYPLTDTTEARYAEMARKMMETGNWLTPMFDVDVPFWGKPPLSFWLSAVPMWLGGVSEFTARLGPLATGLATMALLWCWPAAPQDESKNIANNERYVLASIVFISTPLGFIASGAVMTDMAMAVGTTLSMVAFWRVWAAAANRPSQRLWPWLFFVGQSIGLMAKGPVAVVLTGVALTLFLLVCVWRDGFMPTAVKLWRTLPWLRGLLLTVLLVAPWYILAEQATPGFLRYFIVGEHWFRFTQSGWKGDLYGVAHAQPKGRIWLLALAFTLPWTLVAMGWLAARRTKPPSSPAHDKTQSHARLSAHLGINSERSYLLCWMLAPGLFFTMSGNILFTYVLPGLPAFALLVAGLWQAHAHRRGTRTVATLAALLTPVAFAGVVLFNPGLAAPFSELATLQTLTGQITYLKERPASAVFYGRERTGVVKEPDAIQATLTARKGLIALPVRQVAELQVQLTALSWREVMRSKEFVVFATTQH